MSKKAVYSPGPSLIIRRAFAGRVSPLNFLLVLGFFSTLVLLYISLHVHFFSISQNISHRCEKLSDLMDRNARLTAEFNEMISPERIIPIARGRLGMRAGSTEEVKRLAMYDEELL